MKKKMIYFAIYFVFIFYLFIPVQGQIIDKEILTSDAPTLNPPVNLQAEVINDNDVQLSWEEPGNLYEISYDDGTSEGGWWVSGPAGSDDYLTVRFTAPEVGTIRQVAIFTYTGGSGPMAFNDIIVCPDDGIGAPDISNAYENFGIVYITNTTADWLILTLTSPFTVNAGDDFWIAAKWTVGNTDGPYIGGDNTVPPTENRNYWSNVPGVWNLWTTDNFMFRCYYTLEKGNFTVASGKSGSPTPFIPKVNKALLGYNIYRDNIFLAYTTQLFYQDEDLVPGIYEYCVKAVYDEGESICSNIVIAQIIDPNYLESPINLSAVLDQNIGEVSLIWDYGGSGFYENFNDDVVYNWNLSDNRLDVNGGYLKMNGNSDNTWASAYYNHDFDDFIFEYESRRQSGSNSLGCSIGAFIRSDGFKGTGSENGYSIHVSSSGKYGAWVTINGTTDNIVPWTTSEYINTGLGVSNIVTIHASGSDFLIYINGNYAFDFSNNTFSSGKVGVCTYDCDSDVNEVWWNYASLSSVNDQINLPPKTANTIVNEPIFEGDETQCLGPNMNNPVIPAIGFLNDPSNSKSNFLYFNVYRNSDLLVTTLNPNYTDNLLEYGMYNYEVTAYYTEGESEPSNTKIVVYEEPTIDLKVYLEGPYSGTQMLPTLNSRGFLPLSQPYNIPPWNYNGTDSVIAIPNGDVVDWVLVELRDVPDASCAIPSTTVKQQAAFILNNGSIVDLDGISSLQYNSPVIDELFVVIKHRNHLAIMSSNPLSGLKGLYNYDFTIGAEQAYESGQKDLGNGYGMFAGDGIADDEINTYDKSAQWNSDAGKSGYNAADFDLNGEVQNSDKNNIWYNNIGESSHLPTEIPIIDPPTNFHSPSLTYIYHLGYIVGAKIFFQWNSSSNCIGYNVYSSTVSGIYSGDPDITTTSTSGSHDYYYFSNPYTLYFVVRAYKCDESGNSNELEIYMVHP